MIITKQDSYTQEEIVKLLAELDPYIKIVIDLDKGICSAGAGMHFEEEAVLLESGSVQSNLWGGGVDIETKSISYDSMINLRPNDNNLSNEILNPELRVKFEELTKSFFPSVFEPTI